MQAGSIADFNRNISRCLDGLRWRRRGAVRGARITNIILLLLLLRLLCFITEASSIFSTGRNTCTSRRTRRTLASTGNSTTNYRNSSTCRSAGRSTCTCRSTSRSISTGDTINRFFFLPYLLGLLSLVLRLLLERRQSPECHQKLTLALGGSAAQARGYWDRLAATWGGALL